MLFLKVISVFLLLFNGIGAFYGSFKFITDPSGASMGMSLLLLEHSPFTNYLIPGIILLIANGFLSFIVIALILHRVKVYPAAIMLEGCVLFAWISVQVIMLRTITGLHIVLWSVAVLLIISGRLLKQKQDWA